MSHAGNELFNDMPPFFQYNRQLLGRQKKTVGVCLYMIQDGYWLASFKVIALPKVGSSAVKKMEIPHAKLLFLYSENSGQKGLVLLIYSIALHISLTNTLPIVLFPTIPQSKAYRN